MNDNKWKELDKRFDKEFKPILDNEFYRMDKAHVQDIKKFIHSSIEQAEKKARMEIIYKLSTMLQRIEIMANEAIDELARLTEEK